jgi:YbbR domain-containing protein
MATPIQMGPLRSLDQGRNAPRPKPRLSLISRIAGWLERDMGLRMISLALAIGLWIFVNAGQHGALETFQVAVSYRDLPPGFILTTPHPEFIKIQVSGPRTLLSIIDPAHLTLRLDLTGVGIGQASFKISPDAFPVPRHTEVTSIVPSQIVLDIDKNVVRQVPVHLVVTGNPGVGYKVASIEVTPPQVAIRGPSRVVAHLDQVDSEALSVDGITADFSRTVDLMAPSSTVRLETDEVTAKVTVTEAIANKEFRKIPISVRDTELKFRLDPRHLDLVLRGPQLTLDRIDLKDAAYIEAAGFSPGSYSVPVQVNLPDGVALVHQTPEKVKVRMYLQRQAK